MIFYPALSILDLYVNDELLPETALSIARHLDRCRVCAACLDQMLRLRQRLRAIVRRDGASVDLRKKILGLVCQE